MEVEFSVKSLGLFFVSFVDIENIPSGSWYSNLLLSRFGIFLLVSILIILFIFIFILFVVFIIFVISLWLSWVELSESNSLSFNISVILYSNNSFLIQVHEVFVYILEKLEPSRVGAPDLEIVSFTSTLDVE